MYFFHKKKIRASQRLAPISGTDGHNCMVVGFTTTYAISAYHHWCCEFKSRPARYNWNFAESGVKHHQTNHRI